MSKLDDALRKAHLATEEAMRAELALIQARLAEIAVQLREGTCPVCGTRFKRAQKTQLYCSYRCKNNNAQANHRKRKKR